MRLLSDLRDHLTALFRTILFGPDPEPSDAWDGDSVLDDHALDPLMVMFPFI